MDSKLLYEELMAYLYGEMSAGEKKQFEQRLLENPELAGEMKEMSQIKKVVGQVKDKEVIDPFFFGAKGTGTAWQTARIIGNSILKPAIGLAAGISLIIILGYFTGLHVSTDAGYLNITFGQSVERSVTQNDNYVNTDKVIDIVNVMLQEERAYQADRIDNIEKNFSTRLTSGYQNQQQEINSALTENAVFNNQMITKFVRQMQQDNLEYLERYFELSNSAQQQYVLTLLTEFSAYLESQREEDLRQIVAGLSDLKENQELQKMETDQVLVSILNTVNNQNN
ncbi:MAG: hypothetical protein IIB82_09615 [Bacteroidetes bacterium]|nr:hypothetical protein [Bacteroidota bacterium]